jgi:cyclase
MGDTYFSFMYPFIDNGSGGSVKGVIAAADRVLGMIDDTTRVIPGHGPLSNKRELKNYRDMLIKVSATIERMVKAKKSLNEVIAAKPTREFDAVWGGGFLKPEQFIEILYRQLAPAQ